MTAFDAAVQVRSLRAQLDVLEGRPRDARGPQRHTVADLRGMLQRDTQPTAEEIDSAQIR